ncbi:MAG: heme exporter protein B [marine bacterium B5-7]|nr:MAG: heme exporter protein B [marine bacterium B5-7]
MLTLLQLELQSTFRKISDLWLPVIFFVLLSSLFPLALGSNIARLAVCAPGILWVMLLLSLLLSLDRLFAEDIHAGFLSEWICSRYDLSTIMFIKLCAFTISTLCPLLLVSPLLAYALHMPTKLIAVQCITILISTPTIICICALMAALTVHLRQASFLLALLILPLLVPVLIFSLGCVSRASAGLPFHGILALLGAFSLVSVTISPFLLSALIRL